MSTAYGTGPSLWRRTTAPIGTSLSRSRTIGTGAANVADSRDKTRYQTDGPPLPDVRPRLLTGEDTARLWSGLSAQVVGAGYTVERGYCRGANGVTDFAARTVRVRDDVDELQSTKTLCHELAHALMHDPEHDDVASNVAEVEAESVAYVVCQAAGMATTDYSLPYLARWSRGDVGLITATTERVLTTARTVLAGLGIDTGAGAEDPVNEPRP